MLKHDTQSTCDPVTHNQYLKGIQFPEIEIYFQKKKRLQNIKVVAYKMLLIEFNFKKSFIFVWFAKREGGGRGKILVTKIL